MKEEAIESLRKESKSVITMKEYYYKDTKIVEFTKRNFLVLFMNESGVADHVPCNSFDSAKAIIDGHLG